MNDRELMQQALTVLQESCFKRMSVKHSKKYDEAIHALEKRLALQDQKPVAQMQIGFSAPRDLYLSSTVRNKPLTDEAARFKAQHKFLEWNRQQDEPLVKIAYEYGVFAKAIELYIEAAHGIKEKNYA